MIRSHFGYYPNVRKEFSNSNELAEIINRSAYYVNRILTGRNEFTHREKKMIISYLGKNDSDIEEVFKKEVIKYDPERCY